MYGIKYIPHFLYPFIVDSCSDRHLGRCHVLNSQPCVFNFAIPASISEWEINKSLLD